MIQLYKRIYNHKIKCPQRGSLKYVRTVTTPIHSFCRVQAGQDSQQPSGTVLIKNGTEVLPGCQKQNRKQPGFFCNSSTPYILPPCQQILTLGILECTKQQFSAQMQHQCRARSADHIAPALSSGRL